MIRIYRSLNEINAITFDLDDTLYDNREVMQRTEQEVLSYLHQRYGEFAAMNIEDFSALRSRVREQEPDIYHDVSQWRWRSIEWLLLEHGYSVNEAQQGATDAMAQFHHWRSKIDVPQRTHETLLALKQRFQLAAITNGNADPARFGIAHYFDFILRAGPDGRAKPYGDMYREAAHRLCLPVSQILHVGDHLITDVAGSIRAGAQACWINNGGFDILTESDARILPHIEISRLDSLRALL